jgi:hypothetical protein
MGQNASWKLASLPVQPTLLFLAASSLTDGLTCISSLAFAPGKDYAAEILPGLSFLEAWKKSLYKSRRIW